jgi:hypothetical protein
MTATVETRTLPVVALLYDVPLLAEALEGVFDGFADLRAFPADADAVGLLRSLRPDALIVESACVAEYVREAGVPVARVDLKAGTVETPAGTSVPATPAEIRNALVGALVGGAS